jgi:signal peptidase I
VRVDDPGGPQPFGQALDEHWHRPFRYRRLRRRYYHPCFRRTRGREIMPGMRRTVTLAAAGLALGALAVLGRRLARLEPVLVAGDSMRPTLLPGQRVAVGPLDRPPRRGDLVVVRRGPQGASRSTGARPSGGPPWGPPDPPGPWGSPDPSGSLELVKRVVGLPGERVRLVAGRLEVDGRAVAEPYLDATPGGGTRSTGARPSGDLDLRLGEDQYLLLGDHRAASTDGRDFGPVPAAALAGRVRFAYWPPRRLPDPARMPRSVQLRPTGGR